MGFQYKQISIEERCEIARLRAAGSSLRQIAANLDRAPSSVARELKRNESRSSGYLLSYAHQQARARRWSGSRLDRDAGLRVRVLERLAQGWSPQQVAGRLARDAGHIVISHESIYRFIYAQIARKKNYSWRHYLPRAKSKRGYRKPKASSPASFIRLRRAPRRTYSLCRGSSNPRPLGSRPYALQYLRSGRTHPPRAPLSSPISSQIPF